MRVDQACSPIPAPRIFSPEVYEGFAQLQATRGYTDEVYGNARYDNQLHLSKC